MCAGAERMLSASAVCPCRWPQTHQDFLLRRVVMTDAKANIASATIARSMAVVRANGRRPSSCCRLRHLDLRWCRRPPRSFVLGPWVDCGVGEVRQCGRARDDGPL